MMLVLLLVLLVIALGYEVVPTATMRLVGNAVVGVGVAYVGTTSMCVTSIGVTGVSNTTVRTVVTRRIRGRIQLCTRWRNTRHHARSHTGGMVHGTDGSRDIIIIIIMVVARVQIILVDPAVAHA